MSGDRTGNIGNDKRRQEEGEAIRRKDQYLSIKNDFILVISPLKKVS
jgi:hypothetical protein